jgi:hypothetical protein
MLLELRPDLHKIMNRHVAVCKQLIGMFHSSHCTSFIIPIMLLKVLQVWQNSVEILDVSQRRQLRSIFVCPQREHELFGTSALRVYINFM